MPGRIIPLVTQQIYHVINRGIASQPVFLNKRDYQRFLETMFFYQNRDIPVRYSKFLTLSTEERNRILSNLLKQGNFIVELLSFCLMPNHFHIMVRQNEDNGISKYIGNLTNSYTRYFNTKNKRLGPLYQGKFKAVRIENDEQLLHTARYIHLNPFSSYLVKNIEGIITYPYSSLLDYLKGGKSQRLNTDIILDQFKNRELFKEFTLDQTNYQRTLQNIKHLILEK